jgi:eukaryotic translation initiation factor 2C
MSVKSSSDHPALDLQQDSQQFRQLKSFFKGVSVTLVHRPGLKKIRGLVPNTGNYEFENTMVKVGFNMNQTSSDHPALALEHLQDFIYYAYT